MPTPGAPPPLEPRGLDQLAQLPADTQQLLITVASTVNNTRVVVRIDAITISRQTRTVGSSRMGSTLWKCCVGPALRDYCRSRGIAFAIAEVEYNAQSVYQT